MKKTATLFLAALMTLGVSANAERLIVAYNRVGEKSPDWKTRNYGVSIRYFDNNNLSAFVATLPKAKMLVFGHNSGYYDAEKMIAKPECRQAIETFLKNGGTILFNYNGFCFDSGNATRRFLKSIGVNAPGIHWDGDAPISVAPNCQSPLVETPKTLRGQKSAGHEARGYFTDVAKEMTVALTHRGRPDRPVLLVQDKVSGTGRIIFSRVGALATDAFQTEPTNYPLSSGLFENLLTFAFGELEKNAATATTEEDAPLTFADAAAGNWTQLPVTGANPYYFRDMIKKPWWDKAWKYRLPVLVREPMGAFRAPMAVCVRQAFPANVAASSFRVITPEWREIPSMARLSDKAANVYDITFLDAFLCYELKGYFIYYDDATKTAAKYESSVSLREQNEFYVFENDKIKAKIRKDVPLVAYLAPRGNPTGNQFHNQGDFFPDNFGMGHDKRDGYFAEVLENGPARVSVRFSTTAQDRPTQIIFSLTEGADCLSYEYAFAKPATFSKSCEWLLGKGRDRDVPDRFYYRGDQKFKTLNIEFAWYGDFLEKVSGGAFDEGWYAIEDTATGQVCGEIFDREALLTARGCAHTFLRGYVPELWFRGAAGHAIRGALVSLPNGSSPERLREEYLKFKFPPEIIVAEPQLSRDVPTAWRKPIFGKNLLRSRFFSSWEFAALSRAPSTRQEEKLAQAFRFWREVHCNYISLCGRTPLWKSAFANGDLARFAARYRPLMEQMGLGWELNTCGMTQHAETFFGERYPTDYDGDFLKYKELFAGVAAEVGENAKPDIYLTLDETCYRLQPKHAYAIKLFKEKYDMEPVFEVDPDKLAEPAQRDTALFQMDAYTETLRTIAEAARKTNPNMYIGDQVNPSSMTRLERGAPHDWERHSDFLTTISMDLYDVPRDSHKYYVKLMRSMFDNKGPIMLYQGCTTPAKQLIANQNYPLMWGIDGMFLYPPRGYMDKDFLNEAKRNYQYLDYTGLGDTLAAFQPVKRVAILLDRAGMIDSIENGQWTTRGSVYDTRIQNLTYMKNVQTDMVMSKYFTGETLKAYPILAVTSDPAISDALAETIENYVRGGGKAILEGMTLRHPRLAALAGIKVTGAMTKVLGRVTGKTSAAFNGELLPVAAAGAEIVARFENGAPAVLGRSVEKGTVIALPAVLSAKVSFENDVTAFFKTLLDDLSAPTLTMSAADREVIDTSLMTDGEDFVLSVYNPSFENKTVVLSWNGAALPEAVGDFASGRTTPFDGKLNIAVPFGQIKHYFLGKAVSLALPNIARLSRAADFSYSAFPESHVVRPQRDKKADVADTRQPKQKGYSYVAVLTDAGNVSKDAPITGDKAIYDTLLDRDGIKVEYISDTKSETLKRYDAVIVPNIGAGSASLPWALGKGWEDRLREYVKNGGAVLLNHRGVGYTPCEFPPFPEVGVNAIAGVIAIRDMKVVSDHPIATATCWKKRYPDKAVNPAFQEQMDAVMLKPGDTFRIGFTDYVPIKAANDAATVIRSVGVNGDGGDAVVVAGQVGDGKVILAGMSLGWNDGKEEMTKMEEKLLINAAYWLTEKETSNASSPRRE